MARQAKRKASDVAGLLTDLLITQLASAGVQAQTIRKILGCDINRVTRITKHVRAVRRRAGAEGGRAH